MNAVAAIEPECMRTPLQHKISKQYAEICAFVFSFICFFVIVGALGKFWWNLAKHNEKGTKKLSRLVPFGEAFLVNFVEKVGIER